MSYYDISVMSRDFDLMQRISACSAQEQEADPIQWASDNALDICSSPGWSESWSSAIASGIENPGRDEGVITDGMILSSVQAIIAQANPA